MLLPGAEPQVSAQSLRQEEEGETEAAPSSFYLDAPTNRCATAAADAAANGGVGSNMAAQGSVLHALC